MYICYKERGERQINLRMLVQVYDTPLSFERRGGVPQLKAPVEGLEILFI